MGFTLFILSSAYLGGMVSPLDIAQDIIQKIKQRGDGYKNVLGFTIPSDPIMGVMHPISMVLDFFI